MKASAIILLMLFTSSTLPIAFANASGYVLPIFGNANMDDRIDDMDIAYVEGIIKGTNGPTRLSDANHDGKTDAQDVDQIKAIIKGDEKELAIVDAQNRNVTLKVPIQRATSVNSGAIEIMRAIGVDIDERLVCVTTYAIEDHLFFPELSDKPNFKFGSPDYELIAQLKSDLVILYKNPYKDESIEKFENIGVPVICLDCFNQEGLDGSIKILGELFGERENAEELIQWYRGYKDAILERTSCLSAEDRPKVLFYFSPSYYYPEVKAKTGQSGDHVMIVDAGGINVAESLDNIKDTADVDKEWIIAQDPDVIIGSVRGGGESGYSANETACEHMKQIRDMLLADPAINTTKAAKNGRIFLVYTDFNRGPMQAAGTAFFAKYIHPELFEDLNPEDILKEYFEEWQEIPYRGTYVYPPLN